MSMENSERAELADLDLNEEPSTSPAQTQLRRTDSDSISGLGHLLSELENAHGRIEERIRQLEDVTSRFRQSQSWRTLNELSEPVLPEPSDSNRLMNAQVGTHEGAACSSKFGKRRSVHLIANALAMTDNCKNSRNNGGNFYDCNICLDMAKDPILTCCGHLFCWPCYFQLPYAHSKVKECPVCRGEVKDASVVPIYGNGSVTESCKFKAKESSLEVPPRPHAHRIESVRQQIVIRRALHPSLEERLLQVRRVISATEGWRSPGVVATVTTETTDLDVNQNVTSQVPSPEVSGGDQQPRSLQFSNLLIQGAASFSSLSSALNSAERLVEDLESFINSRRSVRNSEERLHTNDDDLLSHLASATQPDIERLDSSARQSSLAQPSASSLGATGPSTSGVHSENQETDDTSAINVITLPTRVESSTSSVDSIDSHDRRRRRLS